MRSTWSPEQGRGKKLDGAPTSPTRPRRHEVPRRPCSCSSAKPMRHRALSANETDDPRHGCVVHCQRARDRYPPVARPQPGATTASGAELVTTLRGRRQGRAADDRSDPLDTDPSPLGAGPRLRRARSTLRAGHPTAPARPAPGRRRTDGKHHTRRGRPHRNHTDGDDLVRPRRIQRAACTRRHHPTGGVDLGASRHVHSHRKWKPASPSSPCSSPPRWASGALLRPIWSSEAANRSHRPRPPGQRPSKPWPAAPPPAVVAKASATIAAYDPDGDGSENDGDAVLATADGNPSTSWGTVSVLVEVPGGRGVCRAGRNFDAPLQKALQVDLQTAPYSVTFPASNSETIPATITGWGAELGATQFADETGTVTSPVPATPPRHMYVVPKELGQQHDLHRREPLSRTTRRDRHRELSCSLRSEHLHTSQRQDGRQGAGRRRAGR